MTLTRNIFKSWLWLGTFSSHDSEHFQVMTLTWNIFKSWLWLGTFSSHDSDLEHFQVMTRNISSHDSKHFKSWLETFSSHDSEHFQVMIQNIFKSWFRTFSSRDSKQLAGANANSIEVLEVKCSEIRDKQLKKIRPQDGKQLLIRLQKRCYSCKNTIQLQKTR